MVKEARKQLQRFFLHYPEGRCLYVSIVDANGRHFDFGDNTFKLRRKLSRFSDVCLLAKGRPEPRAYHAYSYSVEIDLSLLLKGIDPDLIPTDDASVRVSWWRQLGGEPDSSVDTLLCGPVAFKNVGGTFQPTSQADAERLDESRAFAKRQAEEAEYNDYVQCELDRQRAHEENLHVAVHAGSASSTLRLLTEDIRHWAGVLKRNLAWQVIYLAKVPEFVRARQVTSEEPFAHHEPWVVRDWIGALEAFYLLEFHKGQEFAESFAARLDQLNDDRVEFSHQLVGYTVRYRGEDMSGTVALDEAAEELAQRALSVADYVDVIASQFAPTPRGVEPHAAETAGKKGSEHGQSPNTIAAQPRQPMFQVGEESAPEQFYGGEIVFYEDRVEICDANVCSGSRSRSRRIVLELLSQRKDGKSFVAYSGE